MNVLNSLAHIFAAEGAAKQPNQDMFASIDEPKVDSVDTVSISTEGLKLAEQGSNGADAEQNPANHSDTYEFSRQQLSAARSTSTSEEQGNNDKKVESFSGIEVVVSGHQYDTTLPGAFKIDEQMIDVAKREDLMMEGASLTNVSSKRFDTPWQQLESISYDAKYVLDGDMDQQTVQKAEDLADILKIEQEIQQKYGEDVKLAFDPNNQEYLMLKVGDNYYDQVSTGESALTDFQEGLMADSKVPWKVFSDIFGSRGVHI